MPDGSSASDARLLGELEAARRESAARSAEIRQLAADVHRVLGRRAMAAALLRDARHTAGSLPRWIRGKLGRR